MASIYINCCCCRAHYDVISVCWSWINGIKYQESSTVLYSSHCFHPSYIYMMRVFHPKSAKSRNFNSPPNGGRHSGLWILIEGMRRGAVSSYQDRCYFSDKLKLHTSVCYKFSQCSAYWCQRMLPWKVNRIILPSLVKCQNSLASTQSTICKHPLRYNRTPHDGKCGSHFL